MVFINIWGVQSKSYSYWQYGTSDDNKSYIVWPINNIAIVENTIIFAK